MIQYVDSSWNVTLNTVVHLRGAGGPLPTIEQIWPHLEHTGFTPVSNT